MPDFDVDFCYERRGEVIDYVNRKYGVDHVAQVVTFGTLAARACVRDVCRALDVSYADTDRMAKMIPNELGMTLDKALESAPELKAAYEVQSFIIDINIYGCFIHSSKRNLNVQPLSGLEQRGQKNKKRHAAGYESEG